MKKILSIVMTMAFVLSMMSTVVFANPDPSADVTLVVTSVVNVDALNVGQGIALEASTLKKASACGAVWSVTGLNTDGTTFAVPAVNYEITGEPVASVVIDSELVENWVASGSFKGLVAGTYQISATLTMTAGKSDVSWTGTDSVGVTVVNPVTVTGFVATNFVPTAVWNTKHTNITGYDVAYDLFINYSDNTTSKYSSLVGAMGSGQKVDNLSITFEGKSYSYTVTNPLK